MTISVSKTEAMVIRWKRVDYQLRVRGESLTQMEEYNYLWVLFQNEREMEPEIDRWIAAPLAVMRTLK